MLFSNSIFLCRLRMLYLYECCTYFCTIQSELIQADNPLRAGNALCVLVLLEHGLSYMFSPFPVYGFSTRFVTWILYMFLCYICDIFSIYVDNPFLCMDAVSVCVCTTDQVHKEAFSCSFMLAGKQVSWKIMDSVRVIYLIGLPGPMRPFSYTMGIKVKIKQNPCFSKRPK